MGGDRPVATAKGLAPGALALLLRAPAERSGAGDTPKFGYGRLVG